MPLRMREIRRQREQGSLRKQPSGEGLHRSMGGGRRSELQPTFFHSGLPAGIRAQNEDQAGRGCDQAEQRKAGEGAGCVREEARREPVLGGG